jgi:predicted PurR-regulated permease PerM
MDEGRHDRTPRALRDAAAIAWRALVVAAAVAAALYLLATLRLIFLPVVVALLLSTMLAPPAGWLRHRGWPATAATLAVFVGSLLVVAGSVTLLAPSVAGELEDLNLNLRDGLDQVEEWGTDWVGISESRVEGAVEQAEEAVAGSEGLIAQGALSGALVALEIVAGLLLAIVLAFFFVRDGAQLWRWTVGLFAPQARRDVDEIGRRGWETLRGYIRGTAIVALVDAVAIGLVLLVVGVPLVLPLALLVFIGAFVPLVGGFVAGSAAALVALATEGLTAALIVGIAAIVIQQLEGDLLQPVVVGRAVKLHPVAVLLAVTAGAIVWGVPGAFLGVPAAAVANQAGSYLRSRPVRPDG